MTVDLDRMLDLRDAQVAAEVQKKAELGWFDTEFTMYGCAYMEKGERYYRLSADAEKIYDYIENNAQNLVLPSNLIIISERYPVPVGMQDSVALDVKKTLAFKMQELYPKDYFEYLQQLNDLVAQDNGYSYLLKKKIEVEGCFDKKQLKQFNNLVDYIFSCNKITREHYNWLKNWYIDEMKNMEEEPIHKEKYEKTFFGIGYLSNNEIKYVINARKDSVYRKKYELMEKGFFTTPIYSQIYYYNHNVKLAEIHKRFECEIKNHFTKEYVEEIMSVVKYNEKMNKETFLEILKNVEDLYGKAAKETLGRYGCRWGIL